MAMELLKMRERKMERFMGSSVVAVCLPMHTDLSGSK